MARRKSRSEAAPTGTEEFATSPLDLTTPRDSNIFRTMTTVSRAASARPWQWYKEIGEINYGVSRNARVAGYAKLLVVKRNPDGSPGDIVEGGIENEILSKLQSPYGGQRGFIERFFTLMKIPGDSTLARTRSQGVDQEPDGYDWLSAKEISRNSTGEGGLGQAKESAYKATDVIERIVLPGGSGIAGGGGALTVPMRADDIIGRVWRPGGEYVFEATSPMYSIDTICEELHLLTLSIRGKLLSRFAMNGIFFVPSQITQIRGGRPDPKPNETFHDNRVLNQLIQACTWAVQHHQDPEAAIPIFMTGEGQYGEMIRHITADRDIMETDLKLRGEAVDRILRALDSAPNSVTGGETESHWGAWARADDERRVNVQPDIEMMCWALTRLGLWREMKERNQGPLKTLKSMIWYDLSAATVKTNMAEDSRQLRDRILVSEPAARKYSGATEGDAPDDFDRAREIGRKSGNPYLATIGLPISGRDDKTIDWDMVERFSNGGKPGPDAATDGADPQSGPGVGDPGSPNQKDRKNDEPRKLRPA